MPPKTTSRLSPRQSQPSRVAVILGAGFSSCADLPLQKAFSRDLLTNDQDNSLDRIINRAIEDFLEFTFGWKTDDPIPPLEDIFTMIDLSAGTGHALGPRNPPKRLRALRRLLIYRVFSILDRRFTYSQPIDRLLHGLFEIDPHTSFIVLNWDIVLERHLQHVRPQHCVAYGVNELPWDGHVEDRQLITKLIKVHGSANWVYCDSCRQIYFDRYSKLSMHIHAGLSRDDLKLFDPQRRNMPNQLHGALCPQCHSPVGPHIATFSYRKSFRTAAFTASWADAEQALSEADRWLFVGYSLPPADYEFTHLLKTAELKSARSNERPIQMHVVVQQDDNAEARFRQIFGTAIRMVEQGGLEQYLKEGLHRLKDLHGRKQTSPH